MVEEFEQLLEDWEENKSWGSIIRMTLDETIKQGRDQTRKQISDEIAESEVLVNKEDESMTDDLPSAFDSEYPLLNEHYTPLPLETAKDDICSQVNHGFVPVNMEKQLTQMNA